MYSAGQRLGVLFSFFTSCLFTALPLIAALNFFMGGRPPLVSLAVDNISSRLGVEDYFMNRKVMLTDFLLNLDADFSPLFHWNTKQIFLYASLEYETADYSRNQIIFWDKIIQANDSHRLAITGLRNKYATVDIQDQLPGTEARIKVYWNTVPHVGLLFDTQKGEALVRIPNTGERFERAALG